MSFNARLLFYSCYLYYPSILPKELSEDDLDEILQRRSENHNSSTSADVRAEIPVPAQKPSRQQQNKSSGYSSTSSNDSRGHISDKSFIKAGKVFNNRSKGRKDSYSSGSSRNSSRSPRNC